MHLLLSLKDKNLLKKVLFFNFMLETSYIAFAYKVSISINLKKKKGNQFIKKYVLYFKLKELSKLSA